MTTKAEAAGGYGIRFSSREARKAHGVLCAVLLIALLVGLGIGYVTHCNEDAARELAQGDLR